MPCSPALCRTAFIFEQVTSPRCLCRATACCARRCAQARTWRCGSAWCSCCGTWRPATPQSATSSQVRVGGWGGGGWVHGRHGGAAAEGALTARTHPAGSLTTRHPRPLAPPARARLQRTFRRCSRCWRRPPTRSSPPTSCTSCTTAWRAQTRRPWRPPRCSVRAVWPADRLAGAGCSLGGGSGQLPAAGVAPAGLPRAAAAPPARRAQPALNPRSLPAILCTLQCARSAWWTRLPRTSTTCRTRRSTLWAA